MDDFKKQLKIAYNADAKRRDEAEGKRDQWKEDIRKKFADLLKTEDKKSLLELGSGAGIDALFFKNYGFEVLATDLSDEMVKMCVKRGLDSKVLDLYEIDKLSRKFDAVFALNVLLHIPRKDIKMILNKIWKVLNVNGLFYLGVYGGMNEEKIITDPNKMNLPRFFSFLSDETLRSTVKNKFDILSFNTVDIGSKTPGFHFQSLFLRSKK